MEVTDCAPGLIIILMLAVFLDGLKLDLKDHVDVSVMVGGVAHLRCPLTPSSDVLQIMWQKLEPEEPVTVATCLRTKHKLHPKFSDIFGLSGAGLEDCDLEIHGVKEKDQGCYLCLLITPSDVVHAAKICLRIQERHGLDPTQSSPEEVAPSSSSSSSSSEEEAGSMKQVSSPSPGADGSVLWAVLCSVGGVVLVAGAVCLLLFFFFFFCRKRRATRDKKNVETVETAMKTPIKSPMKVDYGSNRKRRTPQTPRTESHPHSPLLSKKLFHESINENQQLEIKAF